MARSLRLAASLVILVLALAVPPATGVSGQEASLVKDINPTAGSHSNPLVQGVVGNRLLFTTSVQEQGYTLRALDLSSGQTEVLLDGSSSTEPLVIGWSVPSGGLIYFQVRESANQASWLYRTDGTRDGTLAVMDMGRYSSIIGYDLEGTFVFHYRDLSHGYELWKSNGTPGTTVRVHEYTSSGNLGPAGMSFGGLLYYGYGGRLWATDATSAWIVSELFGSSTYYPPSDFTIVDSLLFFRAGSSATGRELFVHDPATGVTEQLTSMPDGPYSSTADEPRSLTPLGDKLLFTGYTSEAGVELWASDGTVEGTGVLRDIREGQYDSSPAYLTVLGDRIFFSAYSTATGVELWASDGTSGGTNLVADIEPSGSSGPNSLCVSGGRLYFQARTQATGSELWQTNGLPGGTSLVADIQPGNGSSYPSYLVDVAGTLFLTAESETTGREIFKCEGPTGTISVVEDINPGPLGVLARFDANSVVGDRVFMSLDDGIHGSELWTTDGTPAGTSLVLDANETVFSSSLLVQYRTTSTPAGLDRPSASAELPGKIVFNAFDPEHGLELWASDGTEAGTFLVKDVLEGERSSLPSELTIVGEELVFTATNEAGGTELWRTDGTTSGTTRVAELPASPEQLTVVGEDLYYVTRANRRLNLWRYEGASGTHDFVEMFIVADADSDFELAASGGRLFLYIESYEPELWVHEAGQAPSLVEVFDYPIRELSSLTDTSGTLSFLARDAYGVYGLWTSDGTAGGTSLLLSLGKPSWGPLPEILGIHGGLLYLVFEGHLHTCDGSELVEIPDVAGQQIQMLVRGDEVYLWARGDRPYLYRTDGTPGGTERIQIPVESIYDARLYEAGLAWGQLILEIENHLSAAPGLELWISDGSEAGSHHLVDLVKGSADYVPYTRVLGTVGHDLLVRRDDGEIGIEVWSLPPPPVEIEIPGVEDGGTVDITIGEDVLLAISARFGAGGPLTIEATLDGELLDATGPGPILTGPVGENPTVWTFSWTPGDGDGGAHTLVLTVSDGVTPPRTFTVILDAPAPPAFTVETADGQAVADDATIVLSPGEPVELHVTATDPNGDAVTLTAENPVGSHLPALPQSGLSPTTVFTWTPNADDLDTYPIVWTAVSGTDSVNFTVNLDVRGSVPTQLALFADPALTQPFAVNGQTREWLTGKTMEFYAKATPGDGWAPITEITWDALPPGAAFQTPLGGDASLGAFGWLPMTETDSTLTFTATDGTHTSDFVLRLVTRTDTDGDGIPDEWELSGYDHPNGTHVALPGATVGTKDVYVHVDYMQGYEPDADAIRGVREAFARHGIALHVSVDEEVPLSPELGYETATGGYHWEDFQAVRDAHFPEELEPVWHYCLFAHSIGKPGDRYYGRSGVARESPVWVLTGGKYVEKPSGSDFIVSLGRPAGTEWWTEDGGSKVEQAGTFMHELGHNLALRHGGFEDEEEKPNYLSVMNYHFQLTGLMRSDASSDPASESWSFRFDYSPLGPDRIDGIDEANLDERSGLTGSADLSSYGTRWWVIREVNGQDTWVRESIIPATDPIDWDGDGVTTTGGASDVNADGTPELDGEGQVLNPPDPPTLETHDDWSNLVFFNRSIGSLGAARQPLVTYPPLDVSHEDAAAARAAPAFTQAFADPAVLWPPDGSMLDVTVHVAVAGADPSPPVITDVACNEPMAEGDWVRTEDPYVIRLRATRLGTGSDRVYVIRVRTTDAAGNGATAGIRVVVPHDQRVIPPPPAVPATTTTATTTTTTTAPTSATPAATGDPGEATTAAVGTGSGEAATAGVAASIGDAASTGATTGATLGTSTPDDASTAGDAASAPDDAASDGTSSGTSTGSTPTADPPSPPDGSGTGDGGLSGTGEQAGQSSGGTDPDGKNETDGPQPVIEGDLSKDP